MIRTNNDPLFCPSSALQQRELVEAPVDKSDEKFHLWAAGLYREYILLYKSNGDLLECWDNEQRKRERE